MIEHPGLRNSYSWHWLAWFYESSVYATQRNQWERLMGLSETDCHSTALHWLLIGDWLSQHSTALTTDRRLIVTAQHNTALKGDRYCLLQHHLFPMIRSSCCPFSHLSLQCDALLWIFRIGVWTWPRPRPITQMLLLILWDFLTSLSQDIVLHLFPIFSISSSFFLFFSLSSSFLLLSLCRALSYVKSILTLKSEKSVWSKILSEIPESDGLWTLIP